jgi:cobalt-zinc-cadmium efflux system outer membrane protein
MNLCMRSARVPCWLGAFLLCQGGVPVAAQGPSVDVPGPPGIPRGVSRLGPPIGSAGISSPEATSEARDQPIGGRAGPSVSRAPIGALRPAATPSREPMVRFQPEVLEPSFVPRYGDLELPGAPEVGGPPDGLTLDAAIDLLLRQNLNLLALRYEIELAQADVLTASLRANPAFYADAQLVPYGRYSRDRPGGPIQYDVNITYPIDVTQKRRARTAAAERAQRVTEAQLQDAVRILISNLYTAFVDVLAAEETLRFSRAYVEGIGRLYRLNLELLEKGQITSEATDALRAQLEQSQLQVREATEAVGRTTRALAVLLNLPRSQADSLRLRATLRDVSELPMPADELIRLALTARPDLAAFRLGVERADAELRLARAERFSDVFLLVQPYTLQDNRPFGLKSPTSWAVGLTVPLPIYNRNQGNVARARSNAAQTRIELLALEREIENEAEEAIREFELSRQSVLELEREILPASRRVRDTAFRRFQGGAANALEYLEAQRQYNEVVRLYRDGLVRHRRAMLELNTAIGQRVVP